MLSDSARPVAFSGTVKVSAIASHLNLWAFDATIERIKEVVPGSPILSKPVYRERLAKAVAAAEAAH